MAPGRVRLQQRGHLGALLGPHGHAQVFAKTAARSGQVPHLLHLEAQPARKAVGLRQHLQQHQFVVLQQVAVRLQQRVVGAGFEHGAAVVELE